MKHFRTLLPIIFLALLITSCGDKKPGPDPTSPAGESPVVTLADIALVATPVDSNDFNNWHAKWGTDGVYYINFRDSLGLRSMTYFDVPKDDLTALLTLNPTEARFYIGLKPVPVTSEIPSGLLPHLLLVGADGNGNLDKTHIYDYSNSCPPDCPK